MKKVKSDIKNGKFNNWYKIKKSDHDISAYIRHTTRMISGQLVKTIELANWGCSEATELELNDPIIEKCFIDIAKDVYNISIELDLVFYAENVDASLVDILNDNIPDLKRIDAISDKYNHTFYNSNYSANAVTTYE